MDGKIDLLAIGEAMAELNRRPGSDSFALGFGGDTSNALAAAARSGARCAYVSAVGADTFGRALKDLWSREGIDHADVRVDPARPTGVYFVDHGPDGHEFSYLRAGSAASALGPGDLPMARVKAAKAVHLSGISQAISASAADLGFAAIDAAKAAGALVSYDPNLRLKLWPLARARAIIHEAMRSADVALPGLDDARALAGLEDPDAIADFYLRLG
ncbi:MAG: sugar kinase, partial [Hyphomicrobiales bacterium]|nr:sugar kinase [Hyphomicrobiales bacterium]